ncbi:MAG: methyltransferase domain-containing protein [Actinobacteria bacterium]|nr:methyltransferase domain-containing protein [Actinomycetota bacterium]
MKDKYARYLLKKTKRDYEEIAEHFSETRVKLWKDIIFLADFVKDGDKILDLGCGNGRLFELFRDKKIDYIGIDLSKKLIEIARDKYKNYPNVKFLVRDALDTGFDENSFDLVYSIALLHQIPSKKYRLQSLNEVNRILKSEGFLILTVWNLWQKKYIKYVLRTFILKLKIPFLTKLDFKDTFIPWKKRNGTTINRYFHAFTINELKGLIKKAGFKIIDIGFTKRDKKQPNIFIIAQKVS